LQNPAECGIVGNSGSETASIRGSFTGYDPQSPTAVQLWQNGELVSRQVVFADTGSGKVTQNFALEGVVAGTYDLRIVKGGHLPVTITGITVDGTRDVTLDPVTLCCGDLNGDGVINVLDVALLRSTDNYGKAVGEQIFPY